MTPGLSARAVLLAAHIIPLEIPVWGAQLLWSAAQTRSWQVDEAEIGNAADITFRPEQKYSWHGQGRTL